MSRYCARIGVKPATLTPRQERVLALWSQGIRHKAIGEMLHISDKTVNSTLDRVQINLMLNDRWQLREYARLLGMDKVSA